MELRFKGWLLVLQANIRLRWKGLTLTNNLAYHSRKSSITAVKSFIEQAPGITAKCNKTLFSVIYKLASNKLQCLSLTNAFVLGYHFP